MDALVLDKVSKAFGRHQVLDQISFNVPVHSVFGFLGQNGAGKTTTMKMILGLLPIDNGNIQVLGENVTYGESKANRFIGYLPDVPEFYGYMTAMEYLKLCGEVTGLDKNRTTEKSKELLEIVGLSVNKKKIVNYSRGMKQRLGIVQALLGEPKLLICDEPTSALDPVGRKEILDILHTVKGKTTVLFSTHILSDMERICNYVAVLHKGKIVLNGLLEDVKAKRRTNGLFVEFMTGKDSQCFLDVIKTQQEKISWNIEQAKENPLAFTIKGQEINSVEEILISILHRKKISFSKIEIIEPTLESLFMEVIE